MGDYGFIFMMTRESSFVAGYLSIGHVTFYNHRSDLRLEQKHLADLFSKTPPYEGAKHESHMRASVIVSGQDRANAEALAKEEVVRACDIANRYVPLNHLRPMIFGIVSDLESGEISAFGRRWFGAGFLRGNMPNVFPLKVVRGILLKDVRTQLERGVVDSLSWTGRARDEDPQILRFLFPWIACEALMKTGENFMPKPKIEWLLDLKESGIGANSGPEGRILSTIIERLVERSRALRRRVAHEGYRTLSAVEGGDVTIGELDLLAQFTASVAALAIEYCCAAILLGHTSNVAAWGAPEAVVKMWKNQAGTSRSDAIAFFRDRFCPRTNLQSSP